jgi:hypothetical protein
MIPTVSKGTDSVACYSERPLINSGLHFVSSENGYCRFAPRCLSSRARWPGLALTQDLRCT